MINSESCQTEHTYIVYYIEITWKLNKVVSIKYLQSEKIKCATLANVLSNLTNDKNIIYELHGFYKHFWSLIVEW